MTGTHFPPIGERPRMLDESLTCIRGLWGDAPFTHEGEFFRFRDAHLLPKTVQRPAPKIVLGRSGKGLLRMAARHADVINVIADVGKGGYISMQGASKIDDDAFRTKVDFTRAEAAKLGRDPKAIEISNFAFTIAKSSSRCAAETP
jgi:alkanesulfonate monooxygenase SsuD/methylene tetrahydromethanopterin reductase-like flavin-dependent oxidoreductase (luciferase family)